jgi:hypothetical protein
VLSDVLTTWKEAIHNEVCPMNDKPMTAKELSSTNLAGLDLALKEAVGGRNSDYDVSPIKVGNFLKKHKDRI